MITRFESKGILGVPDMDIQLGDEKIILIQGPNGSGKTSLLKQITHPLATINRSVKLKTGIKEGYIKIYIKYNNKDFLINHSFTRGNKGNVSTVSHLFNKDINNKFVLMTETGLQTEFKKAVAHNLDYNDYLYNILNIGIENKGIIDMTNTNRLEYLKKIFDMDILGVIKENTLTKLNDSNGKIKFITNKLKEYESIESMYNKVNEYKTNITINKEKIEALEKELVVLRMNSIDINLINNLYNKVDEYKKDIEDIDKLIRIYDMDETPTLSYQGKLGQLEKDKLIKTTILNTNENDLIKTKEKLSKLKREDTSTLMKDIETIQKAIDEFNDKYNNHEFIESDISNLNKVRESLSALDNIKYTIEAKLDPSELTRDEIVKYIDEIQNDGLKELKTEIESKNKLLDSYKQQIEEIDISKNLIGYDIHEDCSNPKCPNKPLREEYDKQMRNLDKFNKLQDSSKELVKLLSEFDNKLKEMNFVKDNYTDIKRFAESIHYLFDIKKGISDNIYFKELVNRLLDSKFYLEDLDKYNNNVRLLEEKNKVLSTINNSSEKEHEELTLLFDDLSRNITDLKTEINFLNREIIKMKSLEISDTISKLPASDYDKYKKRLDTDILNTLDKIKELEIGMNTIADKDKELSDLKLTQEDLREKYINIVGDFKQIKDLNSELESETKLNEKLKVLKQVVSIDLPSRIFEGYLYDVSKKVNDLLDRFMTIRFDVTDGVNILCNREGVERLSNDLSQGEKAMLSVALMIAFKVNIKWDIISIDEGDATLDEKNRDRFIYMVRDYSEAIDNIKQIFLVSHGYQNTEGLDVKIIQL